MSSPVIILLTLWIDYEKIISNNKDYGIKCGSLFQEFKQEKGLMGYMHYPIQGLRYVVYAFSQLLLHKNHNLQFSFNSVFSIIIIIFLIGFRPFKGNLILISNIVVEFLILIIFVLMFMRIHTQVFKEDMIFDICFISLILFLLGFQYFVCLGVFLMKLKKFIDERRKKIEDNKKIDLANQIK